MYLLLFLMYTLSYCPQTDYPTGFESSPSCQTKKTVISCSSERLSAEAYWTWVSPEEIQRIAMIAAAKPLEHKHELIKEKSPTTTRKSLEKTNS